MEIECYKNYWHRLVLNEINDIRSVSRDMLLNILIASKEIAHKMRRVNI